MWPESVYTCCGRVAVADALHMILERQALHKLTQHYFALRAVSTNYDTMRFLLRNTITKLSLCIPDTLVFFPL